MCETKYKMAKMSLLMSQDQNGHFEVLISPLWIDNVSCNFTNRCTLTLTLHLPKYFLIFLIPMKILRDKNSSTFAPLFLQYVEFGIKLFKIG